MIYDFTNKSEREKLHELVKKTIEGHKNNIKLELTVNSLKCIERLIETQERIIEDQEERIAIMSEHGLWIPVEKQLPKSMANKVLVWLEHDDLVGYIGYGHYEKYHGEETWFDLENRIPFTVRGYRVTHWMELPKPPKESDAE